MPYQTQDYNPPSLPEIRQIKSFEDVRDAISRIMEHLAKLQSTHVNYFQHLRHNLNEAATTQGPDLASAATITPTHLMHIITGTETITTIVHPANFVGHLIMISQDGFTLGAGGNISLISPPNYLAPPGHINLTWLPSMQVWFSDTCRLQNSPTSMRVGGRTVETT
jgi:ABC-type transporter Mla subunit MlaD